MAYYPVHQTTIPGEHLGTSVQPCATRARYPVHRVGEERRRRCPGAAQARRHPRSPGTDLTVDQFPTTPGGLLHYGNLRT
jgi:hypothetical protein